MKAFKPYPTSQNPQLLRLILNLSDKCKFHTSNRKEYISMLQIDLIK